MNCSGNLCHLAITMCLSHIQVQLTKCIVLCMQKITRHILSLSLIFSAMRNYQRAFNETNALFNSIRFNFELKFLIIITDDSGYNFDGAKFNNIPQNPPIPPNVFRSLVYSRGE